ncbi:unnamed protein product [Symbiodinium microadriaticum]|nr:unnamed protein product [Symbiodinium microadriaticum]CAE7388585.1 unnamed protein product [Symbiodinium sp. KB8]
MLKRNAQLCCTACLHPPNFRHLARSWTVSNLLQDSAASIQQCLPSEAVELTPGDLLQRKVGSPAVMVEQYEVQLRADPDEEVWCMALGQAHRNIDGHGSEVNASQGEPTSGPAWRIALPYQRALSPATGRKVGMVLTMQELRGSLPPGPYSLVLPSMGPKKKKKHRQNWVPPPPLDSSIIVDPNAFVSGADIVITGGGQHYVQREVVSRAPAEDDGLHPSLRWRLRPPPLTVYSARFVLGWQSLATLVPPKPAKKTDQKGQAGESQVATRLWKGVRRVNKAGDLLLRTPVTARQIPKEPDTPPPGWTGASAAATVAEQKHSDEKSVLPARKRRRARSPSTERLPATGSCTLQVGTVTLQTNDEVYRPASRKNKKATTQAVNEPDVLQEAAAAEEKQETQSAPTADSIFQDLVEVVVEDIAVPDSSRTSMAESSGAEKPPAPTETTGPSTGRTGRDTAARQKTKPATGRPLKPPRVPKSIWFDFDDDHQGPTSPVLPAAAPAKRKRASRRQMFQTVLRISAVNRAADDAMQIDVPENPGSSRRPYHSALLAICNVTFLWTDSFGEPNHLLRPMATLPVPPSREVYSDSTASGVLAQDMIRPLLSKAEPASTVSGQLTEHKVFQCRAPPSCHCTPLDFSAVQLQASRVSGLEDPPRLETSIPATTLPYATGEGHSTTNSHNHSEETPLLQGWPDSYQVSTLMLKYPKREIADKDR